MRRLINRILVKLGLREPPIPQYKKLWTPPEDWPEDWWEPKDFGTIGWKFYGGYARAPDDIVVRGEIAED